MRKRLGVLIVVFAAVPVILYGYFESADTQRRQEFLRSFQDQGIIAAAFLRPRLERFDGVALPEIVSAVEQIASDRLRIRVLFRPAGVDGADGFYFIAASPMADDASDGEVPDFLGRNTLAQLERNCEATDGAPSIIRFPAIGRAEEVLTSATTVASDAGCFVVITSTAASLGLATASAEPYWQSTGVQIAAAVYAVLVLVVLWMFVGVWRNLSAFSGLARTIRPGRSLQDSFAARNRVREFAGIADEFDRMVGRLQRAAGAIRLRAEEHVHAFKTPIAVISQALEPLRKPDASAERQSRALDMIERSVMRLDAMVSAARRIDEAIAQIVDPPRERIDLSVLVGQIAEDLRETAAGRKVRLRLSAAEGIAILAGEELLETVVENLLDNAIFFSPPGGTVHLKLGRQRDVAALEVEDEGPGIEDALLEQMFSRYFTRRQDAQRMPESESGAAAQTNFGIGLWIVRRNIESIGGHVRAENRAEGGLRIRVEVPLA